MGNNTNHSLTLALHAAKIKAIFPLSKPSIITGVLIWKYDITPSPLSATYEVKLTYTKGLHPNVYVNKPILELYPGETELPHVYDSKKQRLCIYHKQAKEWDSSKHIADTVIPWTCEWLLHYEYWLSTGIWHGGGIQHNN